MPKGIIHNPFAELTDSQGKPFVPWLSRAIALTVLLAIVGSLVRITSGFSPVSDMGIGPEAAWWRWLAFPFAYGKATLVAGTLDVTLAVLVLPSLEKAWGRKRLLLFFAICLACVAQAAAVMEIRTPIAGLTAPILAAAVAAVTLCRPLAADRLGANESLVSNLLLATQSANIVLIAAMMGDAGLLLPAAPAVFAALVIALMPRASRTITVEEPTIAEPPPVAPERYLTDGDIRGRVEELLAKISRDGRESLTADEQEFLTTASSLFALWMRQEGAKTKGGTRRPSHR